MGRSFHFLLTAGILSLAALSAAQVTPDEFEASSELSVDFSNADIRHLIGSVCDVDISSLPVTERNVLSALRESHAGLLREQVECMVCFECLHADSLATLACSHNMHKKCYRQIRGAAKRCPKCRDEGPHEDLGRETVVKKALRVFESNSWIPSTNERDQESDTEEISDEEPTMEETEDSEDEGEELPDYPTFVEGTYVGFYANSAGFLRRVVALIDEFVPAGTPIPNGVAHRLERSIFFVRQSADTMMFGTAEAAGETPPLSAARIQGPGGRELVMEYLRDLSDRLMTELQESEPMMNAAVALMSPYDADDVELFTTNLEERVEATKVLARRARQLLDILGSERLPAGAEELADRLGDGLELAARVFTPVLRCGDWPEADASEFEDGFMAQISNAFSVVAAASVDLANHEF